MSFADFFDIVSKVTPVRSCTHVQVGFHPTFLLLTHAWVETVYSLLTGDTFE